MSDQIKLLLDQIDRQVQSSDDRLVASAADERLTGSYIATSREAIDRSRRQLARPVMDLAGRGA